MNFLIGIIIFNMFILGLNFIFVLTGGPSWHHGKEDDPVKMGRHIYTVERFSVGISVTLLGLSYFITWWYFLLTSDKSFNEALQAHGFHVLFELTISLVLMLAGLSIFMQWKRNKGIFLSSIVMLGAGTILTLIQYKSMGHGAMPELMTLFAMGTFVLGGYLTSAVYVFGRFIHFYDERLKKEEKIYL